jgi:hypothetical protein
MAEVIHRYLGKSSASPPGLSREEQRRKAEKLEADQNFVEEKTRQVVTRRKQNELLLAKARGDVIEKRLVEKQAAFLLVSLRQRILNLPQTYARRILGLTDLDQASKILREMSISILKDIKNLPQQVTDPNWLESLEDGN